MLVLIDDAGIRIDNPEDLKSLAIESRVPSEAMVAALQSSGLASEITDGHAWLSIAALKQTAVAPDSGWGDRFDQMIEAVRPYGWVSEDGLTVRAHVAD